MIALSHRAGALFHLTPLAVAMVGLFLVGACTSYESEYERGVYAYEPIYCYRSLADVSCTRTPNGRDERRLVNYYGPAPSKYDRPKPPRMSPLAPPPPANPALLLSRPDDAVPGFATARRDEEMAQEMEGEEDAAAGEADEEAGADAGEDAEASDLPPDDSVLAI
jgi:hypothetical protein